MKYKAEDINFTLVGSVGVYLPIEALFAEFSAIGLSVNDEGRVDLLVLDSSPGLPEEDSQGLYIWANIEDLIPPSKGPHLKSVN